MLRTVVQGKPVLLLDEPFGALDSLTRTEMQAWLQDVWQQYRWTVLMITHDIREAIYLSDRVVVLSARPATVRCVVDVPLPRPRELDMITSPEFADVERELLAVLHDETRKSLQALAVTDNALRARRFHLPFKRKCIATVQLRVGCRGAFAQNALISARSERSTRNPSTLHNSLYSFGNVHSVAYETNGQKVTGR